MQLNLNRFFLILSLIISVIQVNAQEICDNGIDDNNNGLIDFNDPECDCAGISSFLTNSIIPNPSFESRSCCPTIWGDMDCLVTWTQGSSGAALDYIHQCGIMASDWLNPPLPFPDGEGCVGFVANLQNVDFQEYVAACLNRPMEADTSYTLNFNLGFGIPANLSPSYNLDTVYSADTVELAIFGNPTCDPGQLPYPGIGCPTNAVGSDWVLINTITVTGNQEWIETAFEFTPSNTYRAIAIGASCGIKNLGDAAEYYFIDNLILSESRNFELDAPVKSGSECEGSVRLTSPVIMSGIDYQWYIDGIAIPGETSSELVLNGDDLRGDYQVRLSQDMNCEISMSISLIDNPNLQGEILGDTLICPGDSSTLRVSRGFSNYEWSTGETDSIIRVGETGSYELTVTDENGCTLSISQFVTIADSINPQANITPARGTNNNGSITLFPTGGFSPYNYQWSTGGSSNRISGLSDGLYFVTITDEEECEAIFEFNLLFEPDSFFVGTETRPISCYGLNDGFIRLIPQGGRQPYQAQWSDGNEDLIRPNLTSGSYEVTVSDSDGEEEVQSFNLVEPDSLQLNVVPTNPTCKGFADGEIELMISGGRPQYQLRINGNLLSHSAASNLLAGAYNIEITDQSGCSLSREVILSEPDLLQANYDAQAPNCFGYENGRIEILNIEGGTAPYAAELNEESIDVTGARQLTSGAYTLTIRDKNLCLWTEEIILPQPQQIEVQVYANKDRISQGEEVILEAQLFPSSISANQGSWIGDTFDPQIECRTCLVSGARPRETTLFSFQLWVDNCLFSDEIEISVEDRDFFIPNVFTPNGDGNNDKFLFFGNEESPLFIKEFIIFNRWGQNVFQVRSLNHSDFEGWDGRVQGSDAPEGVYIYHMILEDGRGETQQFTGDVSLVR